MPLYHFACEACQLAVRRIMAAADVGQARCPACSGPLRRDARGPTVKVTETLDNGFMVRKLERLADAERLFKERAATDPSREK